jgi:hypothetical protein
VNASEEYFMKRLLLVIVLISLAISGCMEKDGTKLSVDEIKTRSNDAVSNLSSYSFTSSLNQNLKFTAPGSNATQENRTTFMEDVKTTASVNLTAAQAMVDSSTKNTIGLPGKDANISTSRLTAYQIGNLTYLIGNTGQWIHLKDPRPAELIWNKSSNNPVRVLADKINRSEVEMIGPEKIGDIEAYKLKIIPGGDDYNDIYNTASSIAAQLTNYPLLIPSINGTELNMTRQMEMLVWMSKDTYLPLKFQSSVSFRMTPVIVGGTDIKTGKMKKLDQPVILGNVTLDSEAAYQYFDFNKPIEINPPEEALKTPPMSTAQA